MTELSPEMLEDFDLQPQADASRLFARSSIKRFALYIKHKARFSGHLNSGGDPQFRKRFFLLLETKRLYV